MKKTILIAMILVLTLCLLTACRNPSDSGTGSSSGSTPGSSSGSMMPDASDGKATDGDGYIGNGTDGTNSGSRRFEGQMPGPVHN